MTTTASQPGPVRRQLPTDIRRHDKGIGSRLGSSSFFRGDVLRELRVEAGFTLEELGEQVGYTGTHLSRVERGITFPSDSLVTKLAEALDVSRAIFFEEEE